MKKFLLEKIRNSQEYTYENWKTFEELEIACKKVILHEDLGQTKHPGRQNPATTSSLSELIKKHPIFKTAKLAPKTDFLKAYLDFKVDDFDHRHLVTYSLVSNIVYQSFLDIQRFIKPILDRTELLKTQKSILTMNSFQLSSGLLRDQILPFATR
jgi:hypothetical protein